MILRCTHLHLHLQSHALGDFMGFSAAVNQNHNGNQGCAVVFTQVTQTSPVELGSRQLLRIRNPNCLMGAPVPAATLQIHV